MTTPETHGLNCECTGCLAWYESQKGVSGRCKCGAPIDDHPKDSDGLMVGPCPRKVN